MSLTVSKHIAFHLSQLNGNVKSILGTGTILTSIIP